MCEIEWRGRGDERGRESWRRDNEKERESTYVCVREGGVGGGERERDEQSFSKAAGTQ